MFVEEEVIKEEGKKLKLTSTSLKPNIAFGLVSLAEIKPNEVVCDLCCGTAMIPLMILLQQLQHQSNVNMIENHQNNINQNNINQNYIICGDYNQDVLKRKAIQNLYNYKNYKIQKYLINFLQWDFTKLPLQTSKIDVIISNLPFGKQIGNHQLNQLIYPKLMKEISRILKPKSGRAILMTSEKKLMNFLLKENYFLMLKERLTINQGGLNTFIYVIVRKNREWRV